MTVSKSFRWEAAHRLPAHGGACASLHGHSYQLHVDLHGEPDASGMVIDFKAIKKILTPLIDSWDHATFVSEEDEVLRQAIELIQGKMALLPFDSTSENLCRFVANYLLSHGYDTLTSHGITGIGITIQETNTCSAKLECSISTGKDNPYILPNLNLSTSLS